jgi:CheY-like chemotaxis protein
MSSVWENLSRQLLNRPIPQPATTHTVMVTEDDPSARAFIALVLNGLNYDVLVAADGREAYKILRERKEQRLDLLVTDLMMPAMGGKELADRLWRRFPMQKVLFFSGYPEHMARNRWKLDANMHFLQKPFSAHELAGKVRDILGTDATVPEEIPSVARTMSQARMVAASIPG